MADDGVDVLAPFRQFLALERDVVVLSLAMFAFSLGYQMTNQYMAKYVEVLGGTAFVAGLYLSFGNVLSFLYPYPGGALSDRIGSRTALTLFGLASTVGFAVWWAAPSLAVAGIPGYAWLFVGLLLVQAWKSFGLGATFAVVKQSVADDRLATGFASTETFRRIAFLAGPLIAAALLADATFAAGFRDVLLVGLVGAALGTVAQHVLYTPEGDSIGDEFGGTEAVVRDLRAMPAPLRPLLAADVLIRFANGMAYGFFVFVVTDFLAVGLSVSALGRSLSLPPSAYFGVLLAVEMAVALVVMVPVAKLARRVGLKPVVAAGFFVYAAFPALLISAPASAVTVGGVAGLPAVSVGPQWILAGLFAFSGLRFAGLPAHKALIVGPAERNEGGRLVGSYYLVRNFVTIPSAALGGWVYGVDPVLAFGGATVVGLVGTAVFVVFGEEFSAYADGAA